MPLRVLLADDSRVMRQIYRHALQAMGVPEENLFDATDGDQAVKFLERRKPAVDVAIVDWDLPRYNGPTFHGLMRGAEATRRLPLLFIVGRQDRVTIQSDDVTELLERPFNDEAFQVKVRAIEAAVQDRKSRESADLLKSVASAAEADLPFLIRLPSRLIDAFLKRAEKAKHPAGTTLVTSGDVVDYFHVLTTGEVEVLGEGEKVLQTCGDGECFGEMSFMLNQPSSVTVRSKSPVEVASVPRVALGDLVRVHPALADHLSGLMAGRWKKTGTTRITRPESELMGNLASMPFADVIQLLHVTQKTGTLNLKEGMTAGGVSLRGGEVVHAWVDDLTGEEAFYKIASWKQARFGFSSNTSQDAHTMEQPTMTLLMEAMRRLDESSADALF